MKIKVEFEIELPAIANSSQIEEWLEFELIGGSIDVGNPLSEHEIVADYMSLVWKQE